MRSSRQERLNELIQTDLSLWESGVVFAGMDEAGRGPLMGNVVAACVVMPREPLLLYVDDSKKLSEKRREQVFEEIQKTALYIGVGEATPEEIDEINILNATKNAMRRAAEQVLAELFLIDALEGLGLQGEERGIIVEHYIISSGLKEMIEGTSVAKAGAFEKIYASCFYYDEHGVAKWPAQVVNYTNKTQFLFRIEKGVLDINDPGVNDYCNPEDRRVPFRNFVYIGDSDTDVPCMRLVNAYGGHSIGVYNTLTNDKTKVYKMMSENRIKYFAPADYQDGSELDLLLKCIIDRTATNEKLEALHYRHKAESRI